MPVTVKLSKEFYDKFGHDVVNELVNWFNQVDATYRTDLRELNELNFARFDAKLEQRVVELDAKLEQRLAELEARIDRRLAELKSELRLEIAALGTSLRQEIVDAAANLRKELASKAELEQTIHQLDERMVAEFASFRQEIRAAMAAQKAELIKWMFVFWAGTALAVLAVVGL